MNYHSKLSFQSIEEQNLDELRLIVRSRWIVQVDYCIDMVSLVLVYRYRNLVLLWSVIETLMFTALISGWVSLVLVLKQESFFHELCHTGEVNSTATLELEGCVAQDERLNLVFTVGSFALLSSGVVTGSIIDRFGPRKSRWLSCFLFGLTCLFLGLSNKDRPNLIFPGVIIMGSAGLPLYFVHLQIANLFDHRRSSVISLLSGAVDCSAVVFLFFKLVHDEGVSLKYIYTFFFVFAITSILLFTFILPPFMITMERVDAFRQQMATVITHESAETYTKSASPCSASPTVNGTSKHAEENIEATQKKVEEQEVTSCERNDIGPKDDVINKVPGIVNPELTLLKIMFGPEYLLLGMFLAIHVLRLWFFFGSLNSYLQYMSGNDSAIVNQYTDWFGIIQLSGLIFAPIVGLVMDSAAKEKNSDSGFVVGFFLTNLLALLLNILVLIPVLEVQYISFVSVVVLKAFVFATHGSFIVHKFPLVHCGKLYGIGLLSTAVFGCLQYALFTFLESTLQKDPFWINIVFLVLCVIPNALPIFLWLKEKKLQKVKSMSPRSISQVTIVAASGI